MLAFVKYLPWLAKLGSFGSWFAPLAGLIPGGQIGVIIMAVINFIVKVVTWIIEDIVDLFSKPKRFAFAILILACGAWLSADWYREKLADQHAMIVNLTEKLQTAETTNEHWEQRFKDEEKRALAAELARKAAEEAAQARQRAAAARAADKRVRTDAAPAAKAGPEKASGTGMFGLPSLSW